MKKETMEQALGNLNESYLEEAAAFTDKPASAGKSVLHTRRVRVGLVAACVALAAVIGASAFAVVAEAKEYDAALEFFEENGLSADGLSRAEIKAVYKDISTQKFSYEKTADVLRDSIPGLEIIEDDPTPEELAAFWNAPPHFDPLPVSGIRLEGWVVYAYKDFINGITTIRCLQGETLLWAAEIPDFCLGGNSLLSDSVAVWEDPGTHIFFDEDQKSEIVRGQLARLDRDGNLVWRQKFNHELKEERIVSVLESEDGKWTVISSGTDKEDNSSLFLYEYGKDGTELSCRHSELPEKLSCKRATRLGDGFLVSCATWFGRDDLILRLDADGKLVGTFSYETDDAQYRIVDLIEYEGQIVLSAYAFPKQEENGGKRNEIKRIFDLIYSDQMPGLPSMYLTPFEGSYTEEEQSEAVNTFNEKLLSLLRGNYKAVLLVCDESGTPRTFCEVGEAMGANLSVNDSGELIWNTERFESASYSPATSSFSIQGNCSVVAYTFGTDGTLLGSAYTGERTIYSR